jgi:hypothetical protein
VREGKDGKTYLRNGEYTPELKNEISKHWFRIRKAFDEGGEGWHDEHMADVAWLLDFIDIMVERFNDARTAPPEDEGPMEWYRSDNLVATLKKVG